MVRYNSYYNGIPYDTTPHLTTRENIGSPVRYCRKIINHKKEMDRLGSGRLKRLKISKDPVTGIYRILHIWIPQGIISNPLDNKCADEEYLVPETDPTFNILMLFLYKSGRSMNDKAREKRVIAKLFFSYFRKHSYSIDIKTD